MVERIGSGGLQREALLAALRRQVAERDEVRQAAQGVAASDASATKATESPFSSMLSDGLRSVDAELRASERLPEDLAMGKVADFSEVAARVKRADLSLKFAMEIRNKLIDAYREVMRMQV
jgi:flagellar hook-basal body complex protein FliE